MPEPSRLLVDSIDVFPSPLSPFEILEDAASSRWPPAHPEGKARLDLSEDCTPSVLLRIRLLGDQACWSGRRKEAEHEAEEESCLVEWSHRQETGELDVSNELDKKWNNGKNKRKQMKNQQKETNGGHDNNQQESKW